MPTTCDNVAEQRGDELPVRWGGSQLWDGRQIGEEDWLFTLSDNDLAEIERAVEFTVSSAKPLAELTRDDFNFGGLGQRLLALRDEVLEGRGFAVLRGLPAGRWRDDQLIRAYWGIGKWFGDPVSQNAKGHLLGHVIDQRLDASAQTRLYQTNQALSFHSDSCDIAGLLCLRTAENGGASSIASSAAIHNALLDSDPGAVETLYGQFHCDRYGEIPDGKLPYYAVRIFNRVQGKLVCCAMDPDIRSAQRLQEVGSLSDDRLRALEAFQRTAATLSLDMTLKPGDIQFVNNLTVVHARGQYDDHREPGRRRYLVRLWLSSTLGRALPAFMAERWGNIDVGSIRGGIVVPGAVLSVQLDPDC